MGGGSLPRQRNAGAGLVTECVASSRPEDAFRAAEQANRLTSSHWECTLAQAEAWVATGRPHPARDALRQMLSNSESLTQRARCELSLAYAQAERAGGNPEHAYGLSVKTLAEVKEAFGTQSQEASDAYVTVGQCAYAGGQLDESFHALTLAKTIREQRVPQTPWIAESLDALATTIRAQGDPFQAVSLHQQALELWVSALGQESGPAGACHHSLAHAFYRCGSFKDARNAMATAVLITKKNLGPEHVDTWISRFELARYDVDCGDFNGSLERMQQARDQVASILSTTHPVVQAMDRFL